MNKNTLNLGITMAVVGILIFLLMVVLEPGMILLLGLVGFVVAIILPIIFIRKERSAQGGVISFGEAFKLSFIGLLIGGAIGVAFQILYIQIIDPEFGERMTAQTLEMSNSFMEGNMDDEMREQILRDAEADSLNRYTPMGMLQSFGIGAIFYAIISLILAAVLKKSPDGASSSETLDA